MFIYIDLNCVNWRVVENGSKLLKWKIGSLLILGLVPCVQNIYVFLKDDAVPSVFKKFSTHFKVWYHVKYMHYFLDRWFGIFEYYAWFTRSNISREKSEMSKISKLLTSVRSVRQNEHVYCWNLLLKMGGRFWLMIHRDTVNAFTCCNASCKTRLTCPTRKSSVCESSIARALAK